MVGRANSQAKFDRQWVNCQRQMPEVGRLVTSAATTAAAAATAVATATTAAAAATTAATTAVATTTAAAATLFAGPGFVDGQRTSVVLLIMQGADCGLGFLIAAHLNKGEALAATGIAILDHLSALNRAELAEQLLEVLATRVVAQVPHVQLLTHRDVSSQS